MKNLIKKEKPAKGKALFEIILMIVSIIAIAYFTGDEIKVVSATDSGGSTPPCAEKWTCGAWGTCSSGTQTRTCSDKNSCGTTKAKPAESQTCTSPPTLGEIISAASAGKAGIDTVSSLMKPAAAAATTPGAPGADAAGVASGAQTGGTDVAGAVGTPAGIPGGVPGAAGTSNFGKFIGNIGTSWKMMALNAAIAVGLYFLSNWLGGLICPTCNPESISDSALWVAGGYAVGSIGITALIDIIWGTSLAGGPWSMLIGAAVALVALFIYWAFFGNYYIEVVAFTCQPWQPQKGGSNCEACNNKGLPCTEYKCRSLGLNCQLLNPGTDKELCTAINMNDFTPPQMTAWNGALQDGFQYDPLPADANFPVDKGVYVNYLGSSDKCAPPFTKITFGVSLNEPGQCRVSKNRTDTYDEMNIPLSSSQYRYDHGILVIDPSKEALETADLTEPNGGNYQLYVRCQDGHDKPNQDVATFVFKYCIQQQEDINAPLIEKTSPINGWPIQNNQVSQAVQIYVDKPSTCKWDHSDVDYTKMAGGTCQTGDVTDVNANLLYECDTTLTGLKNGADNNFYIRCNSYNNHVDQTSYPYKLIGTQPLVFDSLTVNGMATGATIKDATTSVKVTFDAHTSAGYNNGAATCQLKQKSESKWTDFLNTHTYESTQDLYFGKGSYTYNVQCCDIGGNCKTQDISFTIDTDFQSPIVVRAYNEANSLKIETNEPAECVYSTSDGVGCGYTFEDGLPFTTSDNINHFIDWDPSTNFYIKCKDSFDNKPLPNQCSITVRPFNSA